jgi:hypothetical protein
MSKVIPFTEGVEPSAYVVAAAAAEEVVVVTVPLVEPDETLDPDTRLLAAPVKLPTLFLR